jgi:hypothetical protein
LALLKILYFTLGSFHLLKLEETSKERTNGALAAPRKSAAICLLFQFTSYPSAPSEFSILFFIYSPPALLFFKEANKTLEPYANEMGAKTLKTKLLCR